MSERRIDQWLDEYGQNHQNPTNKLIHWICVPVITWTVLALLWPLALPVSPFANLAMLLIVVALLFYISLSWPLALGMLLVTLINVQLILWHQQQFELPLWQSALGLFVLAWNLPVYRSQDRRQKAQLL